MGYGRVDDEGDGVAGLVAGMDATSGWPATQRLRGWERGWLLLRAGERLLDVGCGTGEAARALAEDLGPGGEVLGVDVSEEMLAVARRRAAGAATIRFEVGDAQGLDLPDGGFDAVRSERTLQWVADPGAAVAEMARVLRPSGRLVLIDTDWSTLTLEAGDDAVTAAVREGLRAERARPANVGRRLGALAREAGLDVVAETRAEQVWTDWDPDVEPAPAGCVPLGDLADDLVATGHLPAGSAAGFVATVQAAAREGRFRMALTMFGVAATAPGVRGPGRWPPRRGGG
ncbi:MAG TPA: methyltransferase domain-containing protein [Iamia sp.]|nr:methyltransferase domain-containing protein [Iamia sp.]